MKHILFILMILLSSNVNSASYQKEKPVVCYDLKELVDKLKNGYNEDVVFVSTNDLYPNPTKISIFENRETGTWTIVEYADNIGCVLGVGKNSKS